MSGATPSLDGVSRIFKKDKTADAAAGAKAPDVPQVPVERLVASPRRQVGRGRRDTILSGADGL